MNGALILSAMSYCHNISTIFARILQSNGYFVNEPYADHNTIAGFRIEGIQELTNEGKIKVLNADVISPPFISGDCYG